MPTKLRHRPIGDIIHPLAGLGVAVAGVTRENTEFENRLAATLPRVRHRQVCHTSRSPLVLADDLCNVRTID